MAPQERARIDFRFDGAAAVTCAGKKLGVYVDMPVTVADLVYEAVPCLVDEGIEGGGVLGGVWGEGLAAGDMNNR